MAGLPSATKIGGRAGPAIGSFAPFDRSAAKTVSAKCFTLSAEVVARVWETSFLTPHDKSFLIFGSYAQG